MFGKSLPKKTGRLIDHCFQSFSQRTLKPLFLLLLLRLIVALL